MLEGHDQEARRSRVRDDEMVAIEEFTSRYSDYHVDRIVSPSEPEREWEVQVLHKDQLEGPPWIGRGTTPREAFQDVAVQIDPRLEQQLRGEEDAAVQRVIDDLKQDEE
jgi:hypothetical protein